MADSWTLIQDIEEIEVLLKGVKLSLLENKEEEESGTKAQGQRKTTDKFSVGDKKVLIINYFVPWTPRNF